MLGSSFFIKMRILVHLNFGSSSAGVSVSVDSVNCFPIYAFDASPSVFSSCSC